MNDRQSRTHKILGDKCYRIVLVISVLAAVALFSVGTVSHPSVAHAGNNGQQLRLTACDPLASRVRVEGRNQNGDIAVWEQTYPGRGTYGIITDGWWWVGMVKIEVWDKANRYYQGAADVPKVQTNSDIFSVSCYSSIRSPA